MGRRVRHLNPANASATMAFDARFGITVASGSKVPNWADRSSITVNAVQAIIANQPTYQSAAINGQPAVRFDGNNNMIHGKDSQLSCVWIAVINRIASQTGYRGIAASGSSMLLARQGTDKWGTFTATDANATTTLSIGVPYILTMVDNNASGGSFFLYGATDGTYTGNSAGQSSKHIGGLLGANQGVNADIAGIVLLPAISASLVRRIEQSFAYSFKLPCS